MLRKKTNGVPRRVTGEGIVQRVAGHSVDRRGFLRGSGLAIGGLAAIGLTGGTVTRARAQVIGNAMSRTSSRSAPIARSAAR